MMIERARNLKGKDSCIKWLFPWGWSRKLYDLLIDLVQPKNILIALSTTFVFQAMIIYMLVLSAEMLGGVGVNALVYYIVAPIGFMVMAVPIAPGGLGVGQAAFNILHKMYTGIGSPVIVTAVTIYQMIMFILALQGFVYYLLGWENATKRSITPAKG